MKQNLLTHEQLLRRLESQYRYFSDEYSACTRIENLEIVLARKYGVHLNQWTKKIVKDKLYLENVTGFQYVFPLSKFYVDGEEEKN